MNTISNTHVQITFKSAAIIAFALLTAGLLSAWLTPCTSWEANIYAETPLIFWIGIFATYIVGIVIVLYSHFYKPLPKYLTLIGWILIGAAAVSLIFLTVIRGYKILNISGDGGSHIGQLHTLLERGTITGTYYPGIYWEPAAFSLLTGISGVTTLSIFPMLILLVFIIGTAVLAQRIFPHRGEVIITVLIAALLPFGSANLFFTNYTALLYVGMTISNIGLLPIFLYLLLSLIAGEKKMILPLVIMNIAIVFYHPVVAVTALILYIAVFVYCTLFGRKIISKSVTIQLLGLMIVHLGFWFLWLWKFYGGNVVHIISSLFTSLNVEERGVGKQVELLNTATDFGYGIDTVFRIAGINIFIYGMLLLAGIIFLIKFWKDEKYFLMKALFVCTLFIGCVVAVSMLGDFSGGSGRFLRVLYITGILSCGFILYHLYKLLSQSNIRKRILHVGVIFVIIVAVYFVSVLSLYPSPLTYNAGYQSPQTLTTAAETLLPRIDYSNAETTGIHFTGLQRYVGALYGSPYNVGSYEGGTYHMISTSRGGTDSSDMVPYHFGYDTGSTSLADAYADGTYIFIIDKDKRFYQAYYPELIQFRWTPQDFKQLSVDKGLHSVYNNGGMEMYIVK